jgi:uncharacterized membrane protein (UPF0127 family)
MKQLFVLLALVALPQCDSNRPPEAAAAPAAATSTQAVLSGPTVVLPNGQRIIVEVASNDETRARGLMFRDSLADDRGMIFLFPQSGIYPFWMKQTLIPLDMIWIDEGGKIVHISAAVPPCTADPCPSYSPEKIARNVLELRAGRAAELGLKIGDVLQIRGVENYRIE